MNLLIKRKEKFGWNCFQGNQNFGKEIPKYLVVLKSSIGRTLILKMLKKKMFEKKILKKKMALEILKRKKKESVWESVCNLSERVGFKKVLYLIWKKKEG